MYSSLFITLSGSDDIYGAHTGAQWRISKKGNLVAAFTGFLHASGAHDISFCNVCAQAKYLQTALQGNMFLCRSTCN